VRSTFRATPGCLQPGWNALLSPRHRWGAIHQASEAYIKEGNITIVRIVPGQVGLATEDGKPVILLPGRHAYRSGSFHMAPTATQSVKDVDVRQYAAK